MFIKNSAGLVAIAALVGSVFVACSSTNVVTTPGGDSGTEAGTAGNPGSPGTVTRDASLDRNIDLGDSSVADAAVADDDTIGNACATDAECEKAGTDDKFCSNGGFTSGTLAPTPVCAGLCRFDTTKPNEIQDCDKARGLCLQAQGNQGVCLPACEWEEGGAVMGCTGKNRCEVYGSGKTAAGKAVGVGICLGGCTADADCTAGDKCQIATGLCVKPANHKPSYDDIAKVGTVCPARNAAGEPVTTTNCYCQAPATGAGQCVRACVTGTATGAGSCPAGSLCSADLAKSDSRGTLFATQVAGIQGTCRKTCAADADCNAGGANPAAGWCDVNNVLVTGAVTGICSPGPKPAGGG